jgi:serine/threonine protein kinase
VYRTSLPVARRTNLNELRLLTRVRHPNIVEYFCSHLVSEGEQLELWLVMEDMQGGTLREAVKDFQFGERHVAYTARSVGWMLLLFSGPPVHVRLFCLYCKVRFLFSV